jgi:hypothetical protein
MAGHGSSGINTGYSHHNDLRDKTKSVFPQEKWSMDGKTYAKLEKVICLTSNNNTLVTYAFLT